VADKNERLNEYLMALNVFNAHQQRRYEVDQPTMARVCPSAIPFQESVQTPPL
jgi:hypothetical protein